VVNVNVTLPRKEIRRMDNERTREDKRSTYSFLVEGRGRVGVSGWELVGGWESAEGRAWRACRR
jgi:hypothetical protein